MKKLFIILAFAVVAMSTSSCRWIHETFYSVEDCTTWYLDEIFEAGTKLDFEKTGELTEQFTEWVEGLDAADQILAEKAAIKWIENNPFASEALNLFGGDDDDYDDYDDLW